LKKLTHILAIVGAIIFCSFIGKNTYVIKGTITAKTGMAVFSHAGRQDTATITQGHFEFKGEVARPVLASVKIISGGQPAGIPVQVILEPGVIAIDQKDDRYIVGGSPNNICFQSIKDQLEPYRKNLHDLQSQAYQPGDYEQKRRSAAIEDSVFSAEIKKADELIKVNANFAGFTELAFFYREESPENLTHYLAEFKAFLTEPAYRRVEAYYQGMPRAEPGLMAPEFMLRDEKGKMVSLSAFRGKYILLDFWFRDCVFCREMTPGLRKVYADFAKKGFEIISISIDPESEETEWHDAIKKDGATWTELWDYNKTLPAMYGIKGYPNLFLLDPQGKVIQHILGFESESQIRELLATYIH
jgi:peroxiredoxin